MTAAPTTTHHANMAMTAGGAWRPLRPARDTSLWHRWKRERACRREVGHCWHPHGFTEWWCCACGGETEGHPPQKCVHCLAAQAAGTLAT
jgi:hypothetical protein